MKNYREEKKSEISRKIKKYTQDKKSEIGKKEKLQARK